MDKKPSISVIVPVYGVEQYIGDCMDSIVKQTFKDFEIILVDDGCKDSSISLAEKVLTGSGLPYRILLQENQGQGVARETGIRAAVGEWVIMLDADDTISPHFVSTLYEMVTSSNVDLAMVTYKIVTASTRYTYESPLGARTYFSRDEILERFLLRIEPPILPAMIIKRSLFIDKSIWLNTICRFSEDLYIMWKLFASTNTVVYQSSHLYNYLFRSNSTMTASKKENILTGYEAIRELCENFSNLYEGFLLKKFILPRWVLGALRSTAKISSYKDFCYAAQAMDYRAHMEVLKGFPEKKARMLAKILIFSKLIFFLIIRVIVK